MVQLGAAARMSRRSCLDLQRFLDSPLRRDPFDYVVVPEFLSGESAGAIAAAFPRIERGGSFPASALDYGPVFAGFLEDLESAEVRQVFEAKFGIALAGHPTMVTLRGRCRAKDGRIHADSNSKLLTALIYMNANWTDAGGRLRLLRGPEDIEDHVTEVPPEHGTMVAFRCTAHGYHGHKLFVGERRSVQLNWVSDPAVLKRELRRHGISAWTKKLFGFGAVPRSSA